MNRLIIIIGSFIMCWIHLYVSSKLLDKEIDYKSNPYWLYYLAYVFYVSISYMSIDNFVRVIITYAILAFVLSKVFNEKISKSIITAFIVLIYTFIAELIFVLLVILISNSSMEEYSEAYFGNLITNVSISLIMYILINISKITKQCQKIIVNVTIETKKILIAFASLSLITFTLLLYYIYFDINLLWSLILCIVLVVIFIIITFGLFYEKIHNEKLKSEYDLLLENLTEYEKLYNLQRFQNHENKNNLLIIRGLINKNNKNALNYIDDLVKVSPNKKQSWMESLKKIPEGGLRGILYYKLLEAENQQIDIDFSISPKYSIKTYDTISQNVKIKICKLLAIYLDNAIQAVNELEKKCIYLSIDETSEFIIFKVANNFSNNIDIEKIHENGYTSKGKGHGYGLTIAKKIIENEIKISNKTSIIKDKFVQEIRISLEKQ